MKKKPKRSSFWGQGRCYASQCKWSYWKRPWANKAAKRRGHFAEAPSLHKLAHGKKEKKTRTAISGRLPGNSTKMLQSFRHSRPPCLTFYTHHSKVRRVQNNILEMPFWVRKWAENWVEKKRISACHIPLLSNFRVWFMAVFHVIELASSSSQLNNNDICLLLSIELFLSVIS